MSDKNEDTDNTLFYVGICSSIAGFLLSTFFVYGPLDHGDRCQPWHLRTPAGQQRDAGHQRKMLEHEVKMMQLKIEKQKLEDQLEPRLY